MDESESSPEFLPYKMGYLTDEMVAKAMRELGETEEVRRKALEELRAYIKSQKNLVCPVDETTLLSYLRVRKFDMERVIKLVNSYFTEKKKHPEAFGIENYEAFKRVARDQLLNVLPYRDHDGCAIFLYKLGNWNVQETSIALLLHFMTCLTLFAVADVATQVCGLKAIVDTNGMTVRHFSAWRAKYAHLMAVLMKNAMPLRVKGIHIITDSTVVKLLWNIMSYVFSDKINKRVRLHGSDGSSLTKYFDPRLLPKEYGGVLDFDNSTLINDIESREGNTWRGCVLGTVETTLWLRKDRGGEGGGIKGFGTLVILWESCSSSVNCGNWKAPPFAGKTQSRAFLLNWPCCPLYCRHRSGV